MSKKNDHDVKTADSIANIALLSLFERIVPAPNPGDAPPGFQAEPGQIIAVSGLTGPALIVLPDTVGLKPNDCISVAVVDADGTSSSANFILVSGDVPISGSAGGMEVFTAGLGGRAGAMFFYSTALKEWIVLSCCAVQPRVP